MAPDARSKKRKRSEDANNSDSNAATGYDIKLEPSEKGHIYTRGLFRALEIARDFRSLTVVLLTMLKEQRGVSPLALRYLKSYQSMFFCMQKVPDLLEFLHNKVLLFQLLFMDFFTALLTRLLVF